MTSAWHFPPACYTCVMVHQSRKTIFFVIILLIAIAIAGFVAYYIRIKHPSQKTFRPQIITDTIMGILTLTSPAFQHNGAIPARYTCQGEEVSPELRIQGVPEGARSLVLIIDRKSVV